MTTAQILYLIAFSVYLVFFILFARFFVWKAYSGRKYWNRKCVLRVEDLRETAERLKSSIHQHPGRQDESLVIENTINHLIKLNYPRDSLRYSSSQMRRKRCRRRKSALIARCLKTFSAERTSGSRTPGDRGNREGGCPVLSLDYALREYCSKAFRRRTRWACRSGHSGCRKAPDREDICIAILSAVGTPPKVRLQNIVRKTCPWLSKTDQSESTRRVWQSRYPSWPCSPSSMTETLGAY